MIYFSRVVFTFNWYHDTIYYTCVLQIELVCIYYYY